MKERKKKQTKKETNKETKKHRNKETNKQANKQTKKQRNKQRNKQNNRYVVSLLHGHNANTRVSLNTPSYFFPSAVRPVGRTTLVALYTRIDGRHSTVTSAEYYLSFLLKVTHTSIYALTVACGEAVY